MNWRTSSANGTAVAHPVTAFGSWRLRSWRSSKEGFESCNRGDANCARPFQRGTGCWQKHLAANRLDYWKRLTQRPMHAIWVAEFTNGESYETDSFDRAHSSICPIKPETGIEDWVSYARHAHSDERTWRKRHGVFSNCHDAPLLAERERRSDSG